MAKKPVTVMPSSLFGAASAKSINKSNPTVDLLTKLSKENARSEQTITDAGGSLPKKGSKPSFLERVLGPLQVASAGVNAIVANATTGKPVDVGAEMGRALRGEDYITGSDLFGDWGWNPESGAGKLAKGIAGVAWDIVTDPLTYITFGLGKATKFKAIEEAVNVARNGIKASKLADYGIDVAAKADDIVKVVNISKADRAKLFYGITRDIALVSGDAGGIKFFGKSLVPGRVISQATPQAVKRFVKAAQASKPMMAVGGAFDDFYKLRHARDPFTAIVIGDFFRTFSNKTNKGTHFAVKAAKEWADDLPRETSNLVGFALEGAIPRETAERIATLADVLRGKSADDIAKQSAETLPGITQTLAEAQDEIARLLESSVDWDKFKAVLKALDPSLSDDVVERSAKAMEQFSGILKKLRAAERYAGIFYGDMGASYFPHVRGTMPRKVRKSLESKGIAFGENVDDIASGIIRSPIAEGGFTKARQQGPLADALSAGNEFATYAPEVLAKRTAESARAIAARDFKDDVARTFGRLLKEGEKTPAGMETLVIGQKRYAVDKLIKQQIDTLTRPLFDDSAASELLSMFNRVTAMWRRWATVMNPGFAPRNAISNFYLAYTKNMADPAAWAWAARVRNQMERGALNPDEIVDVGKAGSKTIGEVIDAAYDSGALRGGQMFEIMQDAMERGLPQKLNAVEGLQRFGTGVNEFAEEWGRLAVFIQAWRKTGSKSVAGRLVDATLYNYDPKALTNVERGMRSIMPFFTWTRRNLPDMIEVLLTDPSKIGAIGKLQSNMADVSDPIDRDLLPQYMRDMIPIPLPFKDRDGNPIILNPNFGFQDLNSFDEPLKDTLSKINPLFKVPMEIAFNRDVYFQSDIEAYKGQIRKAPGYLQSIDDIAEGQAWWEFLKAKSGAKTVDGSLRVNPYFIKVIDALPFLANLGKALESDNPQTPWRRISWLAGVKLMPYQQEKFETNVEYDYRNDLRDTIRKLRDDGVIE